MSRQHLLAILFALGFTVAFPAMAFADLISPDQESCSNKQLGDACTIQGEDGACVEGKRCRPTPDGSEDCSTILKCEAGAEPKAEEPANNTTATEEPADTSAADTTPAETSTGSGTEDAPKQRGCSQASSAGVPLGAFLLGFFLLGFTRRRQDREDA